MFPLTISGLDDGIKALALVLASAHLYQVSKYLSANACLTLTFS